MQWTLSPENKNTLIYYTPLHKFSYKEISLIIWWVNKINGGFPGGVVVKNQPANEGDAGDVGSVSGLEDPLEEEMATRSSMLA